MNTWALVVGCGSYPRVPGASAYGPVDDALAVRRWLLADGGVPAHQLRLLLSTPDGAAPVPQAVSVDGGADLASLSATVEELVTQLTADRLYVFFAGHGCPTDPDNPHFSQDAIVLADFDPDHPQVASIAVRELITQLAQSDIREVVVILDAARGFPFDRSIAVEGFGVGWQGKRRSGAVVQFLIQATSMADGSLTTTLLEALAGKAAVAAPDDAGSDAAGSDAALSDAVVPDAAAPDDRPQAVVRWSSLVEYLRSALPLHPPQTSGQNTSLVLARPSGYNRSVGRAGDPHIHDRGRVAAERLGAFEFRSTDPNAMLTIEDHSGRRLAVGVGSIEGHLPAGSHVGVLVDPVGVDPRVTFEVTEGGTCVVVLDPTEQVDGFRITGEPALRWSSAAAQLAAATASIWSPGHRSFLLVGWSGAVGTANSHRGNVWDWVDSVLPLGSELGALAGPGGGWWKAFPISGPWCALRVGNRRITVPIAPDSVSAVAITSGQTSIALFDTTHPGPAQIAAQDRVQQYLAAGRLGAADLTSRLAVEADRRWPWAATAAVRRLIDGARRARDEGAFPAVEAAAPVPVASASQRRGDPPHQFVAQVPPSARHQLVGRGPWAVWLDWA
jgi:hypothetical protein